MKLYGSTTSPFVRRLKIYLADKPCEFINMDIFSANERQQLTEQNPAQKVPYLIDGEQTILDSRVIYRYAAQKFQQPPLTWAEENLLTLIDAANDSLVSILLLNRSGFDTEQDKLFFNLQRDRVINLMQVLSDEVAKQAFAEWSYPAICLYCLLDWAAFRDLVPMVNYPLLTQFVAHHNQRPEVKASDPRN